SRSGRDRTTGVRVSETCCPLRCTVTGSALEPAARIARAACSQLVIAVVPTDSTLSPTCSPAAFAGETGSAAVQLPDVEPAGMHGEIVPIVVPATEDPNADSTTRNIA